MFKYQQISCGDKHRYIVGCPRVAFPFDTDMQSVEYPTAHCSAMVRLGARLIELTAQTRNELFWKATWKVANRQSHSYPLSLRVGISAGSVAGIVLGVCRRFYCVYGPTVNRCRCRVCSCQLARPLHDSGAVRAGNRPSIPKRTLNETPRTA
jgi:hypothetical protein